MTQFFTIGDNTSYTQGIPVVYKIVSGLVDHGKCGTCNHDVGYPSGDLKVVLAINGTRARMWPDVLACVADPSFVVSDRFVDAMMRCGIRLILGGRVEIFDPVPNGLVLDLAPSYFWIDGERHMAAKMDFEASGFVRVLFCPECGNRTDDICLTYDRRHSDPPPPFVFDYDEKSGLDIFTTDIASTFFFCTARVFECARMNRLTNIRFAHTEEGVFGKPLKYGSRRLGKSGDSI